MSIQIISTRLADVASLHECIDVVARQGGFLACQQAPAREDLARTLFSLAEEGSIHVVAKDADRVVGWAQIQRGNGSYVCHRGDLGMGVLPAYQGRGIARELLEHAISLANAAGIHRLELEVRSDNRRALELYRTTGFAVEAIVRGAMRVDGAQHDALRMCLVIVPPAHSEPSSHLHLEHSEN
jgi:ribosomal protein S18 acetylase RimI-like enzyme